MSSPAASDAGARPKKDEQITFRFCSECSNMLYPKEDEVNHKLMFECRTCAYTEEAVSTCIFRHSLSNSAGETAGVTQDVGSDPTVGKPPSSGSTPSECAFSARVTLRLLLCLNCGDVIRCPGCKDVLVLAQEPIWHTVDETEDDEMDYHYPDEEDIDESSEESLVESLTSAGLILDEEELLWYAGETSQPPQEEDDEQLMEDYFAQPICL
jgi:DNA-directed RNA polymerase subunit M/transcription elongation factor TFIIS